MNPHPHSSNTDKSSSTSAHQDVDTSAAAAATKTKTPSQPQTTKPKQWIRGVNIGGWLVQERYVAPYMFAVTDCHLRGELCWYPGQTSATMDPLQNGSSSNSGGGDRELCDLHHCHPVLTVQATGGDPDYPLDEHSLSAAFLGANRDVRNGGKYRNEKGLAIAEEWFNAHFDRFIVQDDIEKLANFGLTHVRIPLPHWILGDAFIDDDEPWIAGNRWSAFLRLCAWARQYDLQVWPDIHTAPGSQNGFDNSGQALADIGCTGWLGSPKHVQRSLDVIGNITQAIVDAGYQDIVTGFGLLNEPFKDCNVQAYRQFLDNGKKIVRQTLGPDTAVYVSDMFLAPKFNDGRWWLNDENVYLDSHYYQVFDQHPRGLSPRQHIAFTCENEWRDATSCCFEDSVQVRPWYKPWQATNTIPSKGVQRIVGEWSAAFDILPVAQLLRVMKGIAANGMLPDIDREFTPTEKDFMKHFVEAQMVAYESVETGTSAGWFYWTAKMEGGAFAEWDFLRGIRDGWIPPLATVDQPSQELYGTCYDILFKTKDDTDEVIHVFPRPEDLPEGSWPGVPIDDDVVLSHGQTLMEADGIHHVQRGYEDQTQRTYVIRWLLGAALVAGMITLMKKEIRRRRKYGRYQEIDTSPSIEV